MLKDKKYLGYLVIAILVVLALVVYVLLRQTTKDSGQPLQNLDIGAAQAQTYAASQVPTLEKEDNIFGSSRASLKIFVYEDYSDLYSARLADSLDKARADFGDELAVIVRPYISKISALSAPAAQAVSCAGEEGKWVEMRALLFAQSKTSRLALANFSAYAQQIGLDEGEFQICLTNREKSEKIEQAAQEAAQYGILGAPTIFVGSEMILGARPYENYVDSNGDQIEGLKTVISRLISQ